MNFLRQIVAGPKRRYRQNGYNLDLTYITPRIIAMAFPAQGIEKLYRNSIDTVCEVLEKKHNNKYLTINLSNRQVNENKLKNVQSFQWEDHKAPPLETLFIICELVATYLEKQYQRVVAIHCNQGKGRTGTIICCLLLYLQQFTNPIDAIVFYAKQRFQEDGFGVTQPCQIKYIHYFAQILRNPKLKPQVLWLKTISFKGSHKLQQPYLKLTNALSGEIIFSTKKSKEILQIEKQNDIIWKIPQTISIVGDMILEIKEQNKIGSTSIGNYAFNTTFVPIDKFISISLNELSPDSLIKSGYFQDNFKMELQFKSVCSCPIDINFQDRCLICKQKLLKQQSKFEKIANSIKTRQKLKANSLKYNEEINKCNG